MSKNEEVQKQEERNVTEFFYKAIGKKNIKFLPIKGKYPDCYIEVDSKKMAIELRRYYNQMQTMKNKNLRNMFKRWLKKDENSLKMIINKIKKPLSQKQTIWYKNVHTMISEILEVNGNIEKIDIKKRYIFFKHYMNEYNHILPKEITNKNSITLQEYLKYMEQYINNGETINITLICKNGLKTNISVAYDSLNTNNGEKEIHDWEVWDQNINEVYENILEAIEDKINKYEKNYCKGETIAEHAEYNLIIYPGDIPPTLNKKEIQELDKCIRSNVKELKFNNIIIFICNIILILSENKGIKVINYETL